MIRRIISTAVTASAVVGLVGLYIAADRWRALHLAACLRIVDLERQLRHEREAFDAVAGMAGDAWTSNIRLHDRMHELEAELAALRGGGAPEQPVGDVAATVSDDARELTAAEARHLVVEHLWSEGRGIAAQDFENSTEDASTLEDIARCAENNEDPDALPIGLWERLRPGLGAEMQRRTESGEYHHV